MESVANPLEKLLRAGEGRILRRLNGVVKAVNALEDDFAKLSDEDLRNETAELRARFEKGETLDQLMPEASPPSARPPSGRWACAPTTCRSWAARRCTRQHRRDEDR